MIFSSILFIFMFLPITLVLYYLSPSKIKNLTLFIISLIFYAFGEPIYVFLMFFTIVLNYYMALVISSSKKRRSKRYLVLTIILDLLILCFFKYFGLVVDSINDIFNLTIQFKSLPLPIGISFYTFKTLSYVIDVYLKKVKVEENLISFGTYLSMFPHLVAGPIIRYSDVKAEISKRTITLDKFGYGTERFILGLGKKVILANNIGMLWTAVQSQNISEISVATAWIGILAYTFQIYFDFSGYSDMAIGIGYMLGFKFLENFDYPYISKSISEFWRRWHISLGSWFRDYVYIPLGGNRSGFIKQCRNLIVVWGLTGLWHGASYNFIVWGLFYGALIMLEKFILSKIFKNIPSIFKRIYTMLFVIIGWVFFASTDLSYAIEYIKVMFGIGNNVIIDSNAYYYLNSNLILFVILIFASTPVIKNIFTWLKKQREGGMVLAITIQLAILVISTAYLVNASFSPFLYLRF